MAHEYTLEQAARILNVDPNEIRALCNADPSLGRLQGGQWRLSSEGITRLASMVGRQSIDYDDLDSGPLDTPSSLSLGDFSDFSPVTDQNDLSGQYAEPDEDMFAGLRDLTDSSDGDDLPDLASHEMGSSEDEPALDLSFGDGVDVLSDDLDMGSFSDDPMATKMSTSGDVFGDSVNEPIDLFSSNEGADALDSASDIFSREKEVADSAPSDDQAEVLGDTLDDADERPMGTLMGSADDVLDDDAADPIDLFSSQDGADVLGDDLEAAERDQNTLKGSASDIFTREQETVDVSSSDDGADVLGGDLREFDERPQGTLMGSSDDLFGADESDPIELSSSDDGDHNVIGDDLESGSPQHTLLGSSGEMFGHDQDEPVDLSIIDNGDVLDGDFEENAGPMRTVMGSSDDLFNAEADAPIDISMVEAENVLSEHHDDEQTSGPGTIMGSASDLVAAEDDEIEMSSYDDNADVLGDELESGSGGPMRTVMGSSDDLFAHDEEQVDLSLSDESEHVMNEEIQSLSDEPAVDGSGTQVSADEPIDLSLSDDADVLDDNLDADAEQPMRTVMGSSDDLFASSDVEPVEMSFGDEADVLGEDLDSESGAPMRTVMGSASDLLAGEPVDLSIGQDDAAVLGDELDVTEDDRAGTLMGSASDLVRADDENAVEMSFGSEEDETADVLGDDLDADSGRPMQTVMGSGSDLLAGEPVDLSIGQDDAAVLGDELDGVENDRAGTLMGSASDLMAGDDEPAIEMSFNADEDDTADVLGEDLEGIPAGHDQTLKGSSSDLFAGDDPTVDLSLSSDGSEILGEDLEGATNEAMRTLMGSGSDLFAAEDQPIDMSFLDESAVVGDDVEGAGEGRDRTLMGSSKDLFDDSEQPINLETDDSSNILGDDLEGIGTSPGHTLKGSASDLQAASDETIDLSTQDDSGVFGGDFQGIGPSHTLMGSSKDLMDTGEIIELSQMEEPDEPSAILGDDTDPEFASESPTDDLSRFAPDESQLSADAGVELSLGSSQDVMGKDLESGLRGSAPTMVGNKDDLLGEDGPVDVNLGFGDAEDEAVNVLALEGDSGMPGYEDGSIVMDAGSNVGDASEIQLHTQEELAGALDSGEDLLGEDEGNAATSVRAPDEFLGAMSRYRRPGDDDGSDEESITIGAESELDLDAPEEVTESPTFVNPSQIGLGTPAEDEIYVGGRETVDLDAWGEESAAQTMIGLNSPDQTSYGSDVHLGGDDQADESDVRMVSNDSAMDSEANFLDLADVSDSGSEVLSDPASEIRVGPVAGLDRLTDGGASDSEDHDFILADTPSSLGAGDSAVNLLDPSLSTQGQSPSEFYQQASSVDDEPAAPTLQGMPGLPGADEDSIVTDVGGSGVMPADDDEFVLEGNFGSDVALDAGDSGIGIGTEAGLVAGSGIDLGSGTNLTFGSQIDGFDLQPREEASFDQEPPSFDESGSQVIALDDESSNFDDRQPTMLGGELETGGPMLGGDADAFGAALDNVGTPQSSYGQASYDTAPASEYASTGGVPILEAPEDTFSPLQLLSLGVTSLILLLSSVLMMDLVLNIWVWDKASFGKSIMDFLVNNIRI
jgi:hypothetical protein